MIARNIIGETHSQTSSSSSLIIVDDRRAPISEKHHATRKGVVACKKWILKIETIYLRDIGANITMSVIVAVNAPIVTFNETRSTILLNQPVVGLISYDIIVDLPVLLS